MDLVYKTTTDNLFLQTLASGVPAMRAIPGVLTRSGEKKKIMLIRSQELLPLLQQYLTAGIRHVELAIWIDGVLLTVKAAIVRRGTKQPLQLHALGNSGKFLSEVYMRRRMSSGRRHSPVPLLVLNITPIIEPQTQKR